MLVHDFQAIHIFVVMVINLTCSGTVSLKMTTGTFLHTDCKNLSIMTEGSFHGWKFLLIIGEYVVQMLEDKFPSKEKQ